MWWGHGGEDGDAWEREALQCGSSSHFSSPTWRGDVEMLGGFNAASKGLLWSKEASRHLQNFPKLP